MDDLKSHSAVQVLMIYYKFYMTTDLKYYWKWKSLFHFTDQSKFSYYIILFRILLYYVFYTDGGLKEGATF